MRQTHNYSHFYVLLKDMPYSGDRTELKEMLVLQYTSHRTASLKEMEYAEYRQMCADMKAAIDKVGRKNEDANAWRRRVMAVIGQYLRNLHKEQNKEIIQAIACRAAGYKEFNLIPITRLQGIYHAFLKKNEMFKNVGAIVYEDIEILTFLN